MNGALLENFAVSEIIKGYQDAGREPFIHYYRDKDAKEIDVLLEGGGKLCPLEIKKTATPDRRLTRTFGVIGKSPLKLGTGAVLCVVDRLGAFDKENLMFRFQRYRKSVFGYCSCGDGCLDVKNEGIRVPRKA